MKVEPANSAASTLDMTLQPIHRLAQTIGCMIGCPLEGQPGAPEVGVRSEWVAKTKLLSYCLFPSALDNKTQIGLPFDTGALLRLRDDFSGIQNIEY